MTFFTLKGERRLFPLGSWPYSWAQSKEPTYVHLGRIRASFGSLGPEVDSFQGRPVTLQEPWASVWTWRASASSAATSNALRGSFADTHGLGPFCRTWGASQVAEVEPSLCTGLAYVPQCLQAPAWVRGHQRGPTYMFDFLLDIFTWSSNKHINFSISKIKLYHCFPHHPHSHMLFSQISAF